MIVDWLKGVWLDTWSWLGFKDSYGAGVMPTPLSPFEPPGWVPKEDKRRLKAYNLFEAYYRLSAREWMNPTAPEEAKKARREYGDYFIIVETALSSLLGDKQTIEWQDRTKTNDAQMELIKAWAEKERFSAKLLSAERNACKLGDGVLVFGWDPKVKRPRMTSWDPGFFFPDMNEHHLSQDEFPMSCCIAYEFEMKNDVGDTKRYIRRIKWRLEEVAKYKPAYETEPTDLNCRMSDGYWELDKLGDDPNALNDSEVTKWLIEPVLLNMNFIPVIHIPCFVAEEEFWSHPVPVSSMQIIDDLMATDTDLQRASATTGSPPIAISGAVIGASNGQVASYGPGTLFSVGDGGATVVDTSSSLMALMEYDKHLLSRMSVNSRTPEALLGRVKPNEVPSGIALALGFSQHTNMVGEMRLVRKTKHHLIFRIVSRFYKIYSAFDGDIQDMKLTLGSYLPSDKEQAVQHVVQALSCKPPAMSQETAVAELVAAGFHIDDAVKEVERIQAMDIDMINTLAGLGDINDARGLVGLKPLTMQEFVTPDLVGMGQEEEAPAE